MDPAEGELTVVGIHFEQDGQQKDKAEAEVKAEAKKPGSPPFSTLTSTSTSPLAVALWGNQGQSPYFRAMSSRGRESFIVTSYIVVRSRTNGG